MRRLCLRVVVFAFGCAGAYGDQVTVVNMIPNSMSAETNQDSEPNLAVNPANPSQIAGSAFTSGVGFCATNTAPIFVSTNGGATWAINCIIPSDGSGMTSDITVRFAGTSNNLYAGILRRPGFLRLNILRTNNFVGPAGMTVLVDRTGAGVDQPYVQATTVGANDRIYVGDNDFNGPGGRTATIDQSLNAQLAAPLFTTIRIETRATNNQDLPPIRPAIHADGTVYAAFFGWRRGTVAPIPTTDVVVVRDDAGGVGPTPFTALVDPGDGLAGRRVVTGRNVPFENFSHPNLGQERLVASNLSIAVDPNNSSNVYVAWADRQTQNDYVLHVRRSTDRGVTWSAADLRTITMATNPALAISSDGTVGFLYQQVTGTGTTQRWVTHLERTKNAFTTIDDLVLATVPASAPPPQFLPYIGDYVHLMTIGPTFYGIFSANNTPDNANFPNGVLYQRNANFTTNTLLALDNQSRVQVSIDPFFFQVAPAVRLPEFEYAAKIVCGLQRDPKDMRLTRGFYATTINIHNPNESTVKFFKKLALSYPPPAQKPGRIMPIGDDALRPDEALKTDCVDLQRRLFPNGFPTPYIEGFVIIQSPESLDVTGVYTSASIDREGIVVEQRGIDVEQVRERRRTGKTGAADLIPVPDANGFFCRFSRDGRLQVTVRNQGTGQADASVTEVDFFRFGKISMPTPPLAPGASVDLFFAIPPGCHDPDCDFKITVDAANQVTETLETNNTGTGLCIG